MADKNINEKLDDAIGYDTSGNIDVNTILETLRAKDKLIVSLKEAATRRDKLNEQQIRTLSEDNAKKLMQIRNLQARIKAIEAEVMQKEAQLQILQSTEGKLTSKLEEFRAEFNTYREQVRNHLEKIKISIEEELAKREEYKNRIVEQLKDSYIKLENRLENLDKYYKEVISTIAKKQTIAKKYIRHALNDLQEALGLLDIAQTELIEPEKIKEEFVSIKEASQGLFKEFKELKGLPSASTIVKNIENVNITLGKAPQIENIFNEIEEITSVIKKNMKARSEKVIPVDSASGSGGAATGGISQGIGEGEGKEMGEGTGASGGGKGKISGEEGGLSQKNEGGSGKNKEGGKESSDDGIGGEKSGGNKGASLTDDRVDKEKKEEDKKKSEDEFEDDIQEVVFKRNRNYAPFNWREILNDIQLKRFESFIESCIKAEREGNYIKALGLYKTIREQPGIQDSIAGKMLDDHIEYLEDLIKRRYSNLPRLKKKK